MLFMYHFFVLNLFVECLLHAHILNLILGTREVILSKQKKNPVQRKVKFLLNNFFWLRISYMQMMYFDFMKFTHFRTFQFLLYPHYFSLATLCTLFF